MDLIKITESLKADNKTGYRGVGENKFSYYVHYRNKDLERKSKSFSKKQYGKYGALYKAMMFRHEVENKYEHYKNNCLFSD